MEIINTNKGKKSTIAAAILWIIFSVCLLMLVFCFTGLNNLLVKPLVRDEAPDPADVIIVLGGGVVADLKILPWAVQERVQRGVGLYQEGYAKKMIVTGGLVRGHNYTESIFMRDYAELLGVPTDDIIEENQAKDTRQNALYSLEIMADHGWQTALLVTSDYHSQRACRVFEKQGAEVVCLAAYPAPGFGNNYFRKLMDARSILRDYAAFVYYWIRGWV